VAFKPVAQLLWSLRLRLTLEDLLSLRVLGQPVRPHLKKTVSPAVPALDRLRQEDHKFQASLGYLGRYHVVKKKKKKSPLIINIILKLVICFGWCLDSYAHTSRTLGKHCH
jgi:hypothetical protein